MSDFTRIEDAQQIFSDVYKDAYGTRPRFDRSDWTLADYNKEFTYLYSIIHEEAELDKIRRAEAMQDFNELVEKCKALGAKSDADAVRWILEGEQVDTNDYYQLDYFMWSKGLFYTPVETYVKSLILQVV